MIISASRRTDIPAYYSNWLLNRLESGYVLIRNPMNHAQIYKVPLTPDLVDCIVFWTKDPRNILPKLKTLDEMGYRYYFQFTLTPYDKSLERNLRAKGDIIDTFLRLSNLIGKERVLWRYDPIILNKQIGIDYHREQFARFCEILADYTESVTISFVQPYPKLKTNIIREIQPAEIDELSEYIGQTAREYGISPKACCHPTDLSVYGIEKASCIDEAVLEKVCAYPLKIGKDRNQRQHCACCESIDIGVYNTCLHDCVYCYANYSADSVKRNVRSHNPRSELMIGLIRDGEKVRKRQVKSHRNHQISLF